MKVNIGAMALAAVLSLLCGCNREQFSGREGDTDNVQTVNVRLDLCVASQGNGTAPATRAVDDPTPASATQIKDLWVMQYDGTSDEAVLIVGPQYIEDYASFVENDEMLELAAFPNECSIVFVANTLNPSLFGTLAKGSTMATLKQKTFSSTSQGGFFARVESGSATGTEFPDDADYLMPLNGILNTVITGSGSHVLNCSLEHTLARIDFNLTNSTGSKSVPVTIESVEIRNVPTVSRYITDCTLPEIYPADGSFSIMDYDPILWENGVEVGTNERKFTYYVPANMRGNVDNAIPADKGRFAPDGSTFAYVKGYYLDEGVDTCQIMYTFYLGENLTSDFNLRPGNAYSYNVDLKTKGNSEVDGRVEDWAVVDFGKKSRANCYILNPETKGRSKAKIFKIPVDRVNVFWGNQGYENVPENVIGESTQWETDILWCDFDTTGVFKFTKRTGTGSSGTFNVKIKNGLGGEYKGGNAVIGIRKKGSGTILWSWHLWITDYNPDEAVGLTPESGKYVYDVTGGAVHRYNNAYFNTGGIYEGKFIMDRNLGEYADHNYIDQGRGVLFYQFGRKDPFPGSNQIWINEGGSLVKKAWSTSEYAKSYSSTGTGNKNVPYSVCNPLFFLCSGDGAWTIGDKYNPSIYDSAIRWQDPNVRDSSGKSLFDPCPPGWKIPEDGTWADFSTSNTVWSNNGRLYYPNGSGDKSTGRIYYAAYGRRSNIDSTMGGNGSLYCRSCSTKDEGWIWYFHFTSNAVNPSREAQRAHGYVIRPVQE